MCAALNRGFHILKSQHFQWDIIPSVSIFQIGNLIPTEKLLGEWQGYGVNLHMLFAMQDHEGQAYLYTVGQFDNGMGGYSTKVVYLCEFPGCSTIGSGGANAQFWLNYRHQVLGLNVKRSAYHAYEAKQMGAKAPTVNEGIEMAVVLPGQKAFHLMKEHPSFEGCPVSLTELAEMYAKHGPQETTLIDWEDSKKPRLAPRK
jgi:hypothetical protein